MEQASAMTRNLTTEEYMILEGLVDATSPGVVLEALSAICGEKAEHIAVSYGDTPLAKAWNTASNRIGCLAVKRDVTTLEYRRRK